MIPTSHKVGRNRSSRLKPDGESTFIHLTREKLIYVPQSITFVRGVAPQVKQARLDESIWVTLGTLLSRILSHDHRMVMKSTGSVRYHLRQTPPWRPSSRVSSAGVLTSRTRWNASLLV
jgi:hypothetical protein